MSESRIEKVKRLKLESKKKEPLTVDGKPFIEELSKQIEQIGELLGTPVKLENIDELITSLNSIPALSEKVEELSKAIKDYELPEKVEVKGIQDIVGAIKKIQPSVKVDWFNEKKSKAIIDAVGKLGDKIDENKVGDSPSDFIPVRRVIKAGNVLLFDDTQSAAGRGGGGAISSGRDTPYINSEDAPSYVMLTSQGAVPTESLKKALTEIIEVVDANNTYIGQALPGTLTSVAEWRIKKIVVSGDTTTIKWADGTGAFSKEWDERASYTYS